MQIFLPSGSQSVISNSLLAQWATTANKIWNGGENITLSLTYSNKILLTLAGGGGNEAPPHWLYCIPQSLSIVQAYSRTYGSIYEGQLVNVFTLGY